MKRKTILRAHAMGAVVTLVLLASFWLSTFVSEASGQKTFIIMVKCAIPWGFLLLIPAMFVTGMSGFKLARGSQLPLIRVKKKRMPFIVLNGILVLIPCALILRHLAVEQNFGSFFIALQALELVAGALNITLIILNIRAGRILAHKGRITV